MPTLEDDIRARIETFTADLSDLIRRSALETLAAALNGTAAPARTPSRKVGQRAGPKAPKAARATQSAKKAVRASSGGRRSSADLQATADAVLAHVVANPGARMEEIGAAVGAATKDLRRPVEMLATAGKLRTEGQKRGTKYFAGGGKRAGARKKTGRKRAA